MNRPSRNNFLKTLTLAGISLLAKGVSDTQPEPPESSRVIEPPSVVVIQKPLPRIVRPLNSFTSSYGKIFAKKGSKEQVVIIPWEHPSQYSLDTPGVTVSIIENTAAICGGLHDEHGLTTLIPEALTDCEAALVERGIESGSAFGIPRKSTPEWHKKYEGLLRSRAWKIRGSEVGEVDPDLEERLESIAIDYIERGLGLIRKMRPDYSPREAEEVRRAIAINYHAANSAIMGLLNTPRGIRYLKEDVMGKEKHSVKNAVEELAAGRTPGILMGVLHYQGLAEICDEMGANYVAVLPYGVTPPKRSTDRIKDFINDHKVPGEFKIVSRFPDGRVKVEEFKIDEN